MADNPERVQIIPERPPQPRKPHKVISPYLMGYDVLPRSTETNRRISPTKAKREAWLAHMRTTGAVMTDLQVCDSFKIKCPCGRQGHQQQKTRHHHHHNQNDQRQEPTCISHREHTLMSNDATRWAWQQQTGSSSRKAVLVSMADRAGEDHTCYPSLKRLELDTELNRKTLVKVIGELEKIRIHSLDGCKARKWRQSLSTRRRKWT